MPQPVELPLASFGGTFEPVTHAPDEVQLMLQESAHLRSLCGFVRIFGPQRRNPGLEPIGLRGTGVALHGDDFAGLPREALHCIISEVDCSQPGDAPAPVAEAERARESLAHSLPDRLRQGPVRVRGLERAAGSDYRMSTPTSKP